MSEIDKMGNRAEEEFGPHERNFWQGIELPLHHHIIREYENMPFDQIPIGAIIGTALATARGLGSDSSYKENNRPLVWYGDWYSDKGKNTKK